MCDCGNGTDAMAGQLVLDTTGPSGKFSSTTQVQEGDQPSLPILDRSFVGQGRSWMPCAPATSNRKVRSNESTDLL